MQAGRKEARAESAAGPGADAPPDMELELVDHLTAQLALGQHPLDRQFENSLGPALEQFPGRLIALAAGVARVPLVRFVPATCCP